MARAVSIHDANAVCFHISSGGIVARYPETGNETRERLCVVDGQICVASVGSEESVVLQPLPLSASEFVDVRVDADAIRLAGASLLQSPSALPRQAFVMTWNPDRFDWESLPVHQLERLLGFPADCSWSTGRSTLPRNGDWAIFVRLGRYDRGVVGVGRITGKPFEETAWDDSSRTTVYAPIRLAWIQSTPVIPFERLQAPPFETAKWNPQCSGRRVDVAVAQLLIERFWAELPRRIEFDQEGLRGWVQYLWESATADEDEIAVPVQGGQEYGAAEGIGGSEDGYIEEEADSFVCLCRTVPEHLRRECIDLHGPVCAVCGDDLAIRYRADRLSLLQAHVLADHVRIVGDRVTLDLERDLRVVCPNCHQYLHLTTPPRTIDDARDCISGNRRSTP